MEDNRNVFLPSPSEKQSYKFLIDAAMARRRESEDQALPAEEPETIDTQIELQEEFSAEITIETSDAPEEVLELGSDDEEEFETAKPESQAKLPENKNYFRIGEVAELLAVEPHVLRYWESEFAQIRPTKSGGQRVYNRKTVEILQQIKQLLYVEGFSISGARKKLKEERREKRAAEGQEKPVAQRVDLSGLEKDVRELIRYIEANTAF